MRYAQRSYCAWWFYVGLRAWRRGDKNHALACMDDALGSGNNTLYRRAKRIREWMQARY